MSIIVHKNGTMEYLAAEGIAVSHAFTTQYGGVSQGAFASLNIAHHRGDLDENVGKNLKILANTLDFDLEKLVLTRQTHSDIVRAVTAADHIGTDHYAYPECDALITARAGVALMVFTADCTPILLWDPVTGAVGAIHAGWRGTAADIAGKTVYVHSQFDLVQRVSAQISDEFGISGQFVSGLIETIRYHFYDSFINVHCDFSFIIPAHRQCAYFQCCLRWP